MTVSYNPGASIFSVLARWHGTILPLVILRPIFWILMFVHVGLLTLDEAVACPDPDGDEVQEGCRLPTLDWSVVSLPSSLLVFFVVFYGSNCYERFFQMWSLCTELLSVANEWCARLEMVFDGKSQNHKNSRAVQWRAGRLMLASLQLLFITLNGGGGVKGADEEDAFDGGGISDEEMGALLKLELLSKAEVAALKQYKGFKAFVPIKWAIRSLHAELSFTSREDLASQTFEVLEDLVCRFQTRCIAIVKLLEQPVPFAYFHILKVQMLLVMLLISYSLVNVFVGCACRGARVGPSATRRPLRRWPLWR